MNSISKSDLAQFTGSSHFFLHSFNKAVVYTEGVEYLAENAECYWLVDAIASHICSPKFNEAASKDRRINFMQIWNLSVHPDRSATLLAAPDCDEPVFLEQKIPFTDFPFEEIDLWVVRNEQYWTLMLPTEY